MQMPNPAIKQARKNKQQHHPIKHIAVNSTVLKKIMTNIGITVATIMVSHLAMAKNITPATADYNFVIENKYKGSATRALTKSANTWHYNVRAEVAGVATATQNSTFSISGDKIIPSRANTTYKLFGMGRTHKLSFNPTAKNVVSTYRGKSKTLSAPYGALDDLSLEAQIRQDLLNGKFTGTYYMAKKNSVEKTPFKKAGNYKITVPAGTYNTVRIDRIHDDNSRSTSFWLAPSLDYIPVKVSQINDGKKMEMSLTKLR